MGPNFKISETQQIIYYYYILLDPEFYDNYYLQKNYALENNCNKDMTKIRLSSDNFF